MNQKLQQDLQRTQRLATILSKYKKLNEMPSREGEPASWSQAYHLVEMEASMRKIVEEYFPRLWNAKQGEEVEELVLDIKTEIEHLLYHVKDSPIFTDILI